MKRGEGQFGNAKEEVDVQLLLLQFLINTL